METLASLISYNLPLRETGHFAGHRQECVDVSKVNS